MTKGASSAFDLQSYYNHYYLLLLSLPSGEPSCVRGAFCISGNGVCVCVVWERVDGPVGLGANSVFRREAFDTTGFGLYVWVHLAEGATATPVGGRRVTAGAFWRCFWAGVVVGHVRVGPDDRCEMRYAYSKVEATLEVAG